MIQVCYKIMARAVKIIDFIKTTILDDPLRRLEVSFDSNKPGFSSQEHVVRSMSRHEGSIMPFEPTDEGANNVLKIIKKSKFVEQIL